MKAYTYIFHRIKATTIKETKNNNNNHNKNLPLSRRLLPSRYIDYVTTTQQKKKTNKNIASIDKWKKKYEWLKGS